MVTQRKTEEEIIGILIKRFRDCPDSFPSIPPHKCVAKTTNNNQHENKRKLDCIFSGHTRHKSLSLRSASHGKLASSFHHTLTIHMKINHIICITYPYSHPIYAHAPCTSYKSILCDALHSVTLGIRPYTLYHAIQHLHIHITRRLERKDVFTRT